MTVASNPTQGNTLWKTFNASIIATQTPMTQKVAPRTEGEVRPGDVIYIRPHVVETPGWMCPAGSPKAASPHMYSGEQAVVLQLVPLSDSVIVRIITKTPPCLTAVNIGAIEVILRGDE